MTDNRINVNRESLLRIARLTKSIIDITVNNGMVDGILAKPKNIDELKNHNEIISDIIVEKLRTKFKIK